MDSSDEVILFSITILSYSFEISYTPTRSSSTTMESSQTNDSLMNASKITPSVLNHLRKVYQILCYAITACAVGACCHMMWNIGGKLIAFPTLGCMLWLRLTPRMDKQKRVGLLMACSLLIGAMVAPILKLVHPSIWVSAFMGTAIVFACLSGAAMLTRLGEACRDFSYDVSIVTWFLFAIMFLHFFLHGSFGDLIHYWFWAALVGCVLNILVDTHKIIQMEKANNKGLDYFVHAVMLFTDFIDAFFIAFIIAFSIAVNRIERIEGARLF